MPLSTEERGLLEKQIDSALVILPDLVKNMRASKQRMHFKEPDDAAFGYALGYIMASFLPTLTARAFNNTLTLDIMNEAADVMFKRSSEIRSKITESG